MKKVLALLLAFVMIFAFCSCENVKVIIEEGSSSGEVAEIEIETVNSKSKKKSSKNKSSKKTKSYISDDDDFDDEEYDDDDDDEETSQTTTSADSKSGKSESSKNTSSEAKTSSKTSSKNSSSQKSNTSSTTSSDIKVGYNPDDKIGLGFYHFNIAWSKDNNAATVPGFETKLKEFTEVIKEGYVNTVVMSSEGMDKKEVWDVILKYDINVWLSVYDYFDSSKQTIGAFTGNIEKILAFAKGNSKYWEHVCGFHYDEPIWRGQSNQDYLDMTKALYQKFGKRNFPVFATGEFTNYEGNEMQLGMSAVKMKKILTPSMKYTSDVGYDSYSYDVRDGYNNGSQINKMHQTYPAIVDGKTYYEVMCEEMLKVVGHDANVWFFPCGYTTNTWGGYWVDEGYVDAHIKFFADLLKKQKYQGGLMLYTYTDFSKAKEGKEYGLRRHLVISNASVQNLMYPETPKWSKVSKTIKDTVADFNKTKPKKYNID